MRFGWWNRLVMRLSSKTPRGRRRTPRRERARLLLEGLESRDLLSGFAPTYVLAPLGQGATAYSSAGPTGYSPSQVRHAYGFDQISLPGGAAADGSGTTIAIVDAYDDPNIAGDLHNFDQYFGLPDPNFSKVNENGGSALPAADGGWSSEIALDVEWSHAIAPKANILLVEASSSSLSDLLTGVQYASAQPGVVVVSMSWGGGEFSSETSLDSYFTTPSGHAGVAFVASAGDSGAPDSYPSASPNVLSVGGTTLNLGTAGAYGSESAWSGSGGGISSVEGQPSYQQGVVTQSSTWRTNPDVSYDADPATGFSVYDSYNNGTAAPWSQFGGTSAGAPQWSALVAIADQGRALLGKGSLDGGSQLLPTLYSLPGTDFHDVTSGTSTGSPNYSAGPGYDLVTGRGSPYADRVVADLVGYHPASVAPSAPTGLSATAASSSQINLSWSAASGATSYAVQRSPDGSTGWTQIASGLSGTTYSDTGLQAGTAYYYRVLAANSSSSSAPSATATATTQAAPPASSGVLFSDNFNSSAVNPAWSFVNGTWSQANGVLAQTSTGAGDPKKALVTNQTFPAAVTVTARVRVDSWAGGDYARAGVSLYNNPTTGAGYNLLFHNTTGSNGTVQFLNDGVAWGNSYSFNWSVGTWYWFKLQDNNGVLQGKVWQDGTAEPTNWMFTQSGWTDRTGGAPGLNGGSGSASTASFDDFSVSTTAAAPVSAPAAPTGLSAVAASSSQINLSWSAASGATSYAVQRSPDGSTGWTQIASGLSGTSYSDAGLQASTAYYYRVLAANSSGSSAPSATASATTQAAPPAGSGVLFSDNFSSSSINPAWSFVGGTWTQSGGVLSQSSSTIADPKKALVTGQTFPANVEITARVRVNSWSAGDYARAGVSLDNNPTTGAGYNLIFHGGTGSGGTVQFLDDGNAWGNSYSFNWSVGTWYWFKLEDVNGVLQGKVWQDGTSEPTSWMFTQTGWTDRTGGAPGLHGGSNNNATVSFSSVTITDPTVTGQALPALSRGENAGTAARPNFVWTASTADPRVVAGSTPDAHQLPPYLFNGNDASRPGPGADVPTHTALNTGTASPSAGSVYMIRNPGGPAQVRLVRPTDSGTDLFQK